MQASIQIVCPGCGKLFHIQAAQADAALSCTNCGKSIKVLQHSSVRLQAVEAQTDEPAVNASAVISGHFGTVKQSMPTLNAGSGQPPAVAASKSFPPTARALSADPDSALVAAASTAFQVKGWQCANWSGHLAFAAEVKVASAKKGIDESLNLTVSAAGGILRLETVVAPLPKPPLTPLREILHRINFRAGGTFFQIRECGVSARYLVFPRRASGGNLTQDEVLSALRQLNHDRLNAAPLLLKEEEIRSHSMSPQLIDRAFAAPLFAGVPSSVTAVQLRELANLADFPVKIKGAMLYLAAEPKRPDVYPVWLSLSSQVVRGWTIPGSAAPERSASVSWFRRIVGQAELPPPPKLSKPQFETLLKKLDALNESSGLLQHVWNGQQVLGLVVFPPTEKRMGVEDFKFLAGVLHQRARDAMPELKGTPLANYVSATG